MRQGPASVAKVVGGEAGKEPESMMLESHADDGRCFGFYSRNEGKSWEGLMWEYNNVLIYIFQRSAVGERRWEKGKE